MMRTFLARQSSVRIRCFCSGMRRQEARSRSRTNISTSISARFVLRRDRPDHGLGARARRHRARPRVPGDALRVSLRDATGAGAAQTKILRVTAGTTGTREVDVIYASLASPLHEHSGGRLIFGPDGMLYVTVGDASDPGAAQDLASTRGKIFRLTPGWGGRAGEPVRIARWASGIRNSFGLAFDPVTGNLWETENGPECTDRAEPDRARGELRMGAGGGLRGPRHRPRTRTAMGRPDIPPALVHADDRTHGRGLLRRVLAGPPLRGHALLRYLQHRGALRAELSRDRTGASVAARWWRHRATCCFSPRSDPTVPSTTAPLPRDLATRTQLGVRRGQQGFLGGPDAPGPSAPHMPAFADDDGGGGGDGHDIDVRDRESRRPTQRVATIRERVQMTAIGQAMGRVSARSRGPRRSGSGDRRAAVRHLSRGRSRRGRGGTGVPRLGERRSRACAQCHPRRRPCGVHRAHGSVRGGRPSLRRARSRVQMHGRRVVGPARECT